MRRQAVRQRFRFRSAASRSSAGMPSRPPSRVSSIQRPYTATKVPSARVISSRSFSRASHDASSAFGRSSRNPASIVCAAALLPFTFADGSHVVATWSTPVAVADFHSAATPCPTAYSATSRYSSAADRTSSSSDAERTAGRGRIAPAPPRSTARTSSPVWNRQHSSRSLSSRSMASLTRVAVTTCPSPPIRRLMCTRTSGSETRAPSASRNSCVDHAPASPAGIS